MPGARATAPLVFESVPVPALHCPPGQGGATSVLLDPALSTLGPAGSETVAAPSGLGQEFPCALQMEGRAFVEARSQEGWRHWGM